MDKVDAKSKEKILSPAYKRLKQTYKSIVKLLQANGKTAHNFFTRDGTPSLELS